MAAVAAAALLTACTRQPGFISGTVALDETVALVRGPSNDSATREFDAIDDCVVIALVDERLTDVTLALTVTRDGKTLGALEVDNHLAGAGIEIASLHAPKGARVNVTLAGAPRSKEPGAVGLRVKLYSESPADGSADAALIAAARLWAEATDVRMRPSSFKESGLAKLNDAIAKLAGPAGDPALAAQARLVRARALQYFELDAREARAEARRAADAFSRLPAPDTLAVARANYLEALALADMAVDRDSVAPTSKEAVGLAVTLLTALTSDTSAFGPIEKARAVAALGDLEINGMRNEDATRHFEQARGMFAAAGDLGGERDMRFRLPAVLVEQGRFAEAAKVYDPLRAELDLIADPRLRIRAYLAMARSLSSFSGRPDEAVPLLLKILPYARDHQVQRELARALENLGYIYMLRGDLLEATSFHDEALKIMSQQKDDSAYVFALLTAADAARWDGDLDRALALGEEAFRRAKSPMAKARAPVQLSRIYLAKNDYSACVKILRESLAVDLGDPLHHAHTDARLGIAECLIESPDSTPADFDDADRELRLALEKSQKFGDVGRTISSYRQMGHLEARRGHSAAALRDFDRVLTLSRELRARSTSTEVNATMLRDEQFAMRGYLEIVFANAARRAPGTLAGPSPAELTAFRRLEDARRASFGALRAGALDAATTRKIDDLMQKMAQTSLRISSLLDGDRNAAQDSEIHNLQLEMSQLHAQIDDLRWSAAAKAAATTQASTAWRALTPGIAQISYILAEKHVYALVRSAAGMRLTALAPSFDELEARLVRFNELDVRTASPDVEHALDELSAALLPPGIVPSGTRALEFIAEGRIASVPFAALRSPRDPTRRLVETHDVEMVTSMLAFDEAPRPKVARPYRLIALASGHGTWRAAGAPDPLPKLRTATKEIEVAAALFKARDPGAKVKLLTGVDGNATALHDAWAGGADVVHFATHALPDLRQPIASLLVLPATDEAGRATYLTAGQVQAWRGDAELVFLSACESAVGPPQYAAGMPGLQRAFLRAGARGVIATLAPIEDILAQQFAADFYSRYTQGMPAARALSETQRAWLQPAPGLRAEDQRRRRITALSHAYFTG